jgi:SSS family solute:Na+ symporter
VIYNDILAPFRARAQTDKRGLLLNRALVAAIGVFLLFYGLWYPLSSDLWAYCTITGTIYLSSMSVLLISCCYWKGANSWGAFSAIFLGAVFPLAFLILQQIPSTKAFAAEIGSDRSGLLAFAAAALGMLVGSACKPRRSA